MPKSAFPRAGFGYSFPDGSAEHESGQDGMTLEEYYLGQLLIHYNKPDALSMNVYINILIVCARCAAEEIRSAQKEWENVPK